MKILIPSVLVGLFTLASSVTADDHWVVYEGKEGPGEGKHVVLIAGDEEYRSEEALPQLGKILSERHGFKCTVLFSINPEDGTIDPNNQKNIPGLEALESGDMMVIATRFRNLPDDQMKHVVDFVNSGKPIMGLRTATHAFNLDDESSYKKYSYNSSEWQGGFGQQVLGETWINHHGNHGTESTRGIVEEENKDHPILKGVDDIWGPTDVYGVRNLVDEATILVRGQVIAGMEPGDEPVEGDKNDPMMPLAWTKTFTGDSGETSKVFCTTMGSSTDLESEGFRRLLVNGVYWGVGLEDEIKADANVDVVGEFKPTPFGFNAFTKGVKPADHSL